MAMTIERTGRFQAISDGGELFTIFEWTRFDNFNSSAGYFSVPGTVSLETSDGYPVNPLANGEFEIVERGIRLKRLDPVPQ